MGIVTNGSFVLEPRFATTIARGTIVVTMSDSSRDDKEHDRLAPDRLRADIQAGFDQLASKTRNRFAASSRTSRREDLRCDRAHGTCKTESRVQGTTHGLHTRSK